MTAQTAGILLGIFSVLCSIGIYWGAFAEEKRAKTDPHAALTKG